MLPDFHVGNICFTAPALAHASEADLLRSLEQTQIGYTRGPLNIISKPNMPKYLVRPSHVPASNASLAASINIIDFGQSFTASARPSTLRTPLVFRPPEILFEDDFDYRVDLWSMGCTVRLRMYLPSVFH